MNQSFYNEPSGSTAAMNGVVRFLANLGVAPAGAHTLRVVGRKSGNVQEVPVNLLEQDGAFFLVSPRGNTQWVRNLRAAGELELRRGRRVTRYRATEVGDGAKVPVLRGYLTKWIKQVRNLLPAPVDGSSPDAELADIAPKLPVFALTPVG